MIVPEVPPTRDEVAGHYDELDRFYREIWGQHVHHGLWRRGDESLEEAVEGLVEEVADRARIASGDRVCDVGCGYGATARRLARGRGAQVVGYTVSRAQHAAAAAATASSSPAAPGSVRVELGDWLESGLPDRSFDAVLAVESTEHLSDRPRFFEEAHRILVPGGRLVACSWWAAPGARGWQVRHLLEPICREGRLTGLGTAGEYRAWARDAGFREVEVEDWTDATRRTWDVCLGRLLRRLLTREAWRYLLDADNRHRAFALAPFRIWTAYRTGALRYGALTAVR